MLSKKDQLSLAMIAKEEALTYGMDSTELPGLIASIVGDVPDETMQTLLKQGLRVLSEMTVEEYQCLPGIDKEKSARLAAAFELARRMNRLMPERRPSIKSPETAAALVMEEMRHLDREHFCVLLLNTKNQVLTREVISIGTLNSSMVHPREVFKSAIRRSAARVILVHNHPSGDPTPSEHDIAVTKRLKEAGDLVGISVMDHLIIGDNRFTSLKAKGLIL